MGSSKSTETNKKKALDLALSQIEKQFGKGAIMRLGGDMHLDVAALSTGIISLDKALDRLRPILCLWEPKQYPY